MKLNDLKIKVLISSLSLLSLPMLAFADFTLIGSNFKDLVGYVLDTISILIPVMYSAAFVVFFWGLSIFILKDSNSEKTRADGKKKMLWGIAGLFVLTSFRVIVALISSDLGFGPGYDLPFLHDGVRNDSTGRMIPPGQIPPQ